MSSKRIAIVGGGASGYFTAIHAAQNSNDSKIFIFEKAKDVLQKVRISGGGRCNVTHACFDPKELTKFYPRGEKELLGPFHKFCSGDTMDWFEKRGVELKIEEDDRVFPVSDSSEDIAQALIQEARENNIETLTQMAVVDIRRKDEGFIIEFTNGQQSFFDAVVISSGSSGKIWEILEKLGHSIVTPVPSLFTFNIKDSRLNNLQGVSVPMVHSKIEGTSFETTGPLLITHWGISGPGILKLSAIGARKLAEMNYEATIVLNWLGEMEERDAFSIVENWKKENPKKQLLSGPFSNLSKRLWMKLIEFTHLDGNETWANVPHASIQRLAHQLTHAKLGMKGKSTNKEEFVTAGGVELKEIDFKSFQSKLIPNLFLVGECINIDAVTGGFNFQAAWTAGYIAGNFLSQNS
jgi:hypothetical protein